MNDTYGERLVKSATTFLSRWRGATAQMRELTMSHQTLVLRLFRDRDMSSYLIIACVEPQYIKGPVLWNDSNLVVSAWMEDDWVFLITDIEAGVEIRCGKIEVRETT